jgi:hypothetical protein
MDLNALPTSVDWRNVNSANLVTKDLNQVWHFQTV